MLLLDWPPAAAVPEPVEPVALPLGAAPVELVPPGFAAPREPPVLLAEESIRPTISTWCPTWVRRSLVCPSSMYVIVLALAAPVLAAVPVEPGAGVVAPDPRAPPAAPLSPAALMRAFDSTNSSALLAAVPVPNPKLRRPRRHVAGDVPSSVNPPSGCAFHTRCPHAMARCRAETPPLLEVAPRHWVACHLHQAS